ncbi:MAG: hypothetical protein IJP86_09175 [Synergistaceae bacterium]|nr:hypothetical protein [Synergistaceae bacterium]
MRKHSAAIIQHYYGKLPNYFPLWLKSAGCNPQFDFMIFTDCDFSGYKVPGNVHVIHMTFDELRARIAQHLDFPFVCDTAYKACDYRPMYGLIFEDYLADYEFWGTCDPDEIWGDMGRFITPEILDNYSRIYRLGHLQLFRNTEDVRTFALHELPSCPFSYKDIFRTKAHIAYEEKALAAELFSRFTLAGGGGSTGRLTTLMCTLTSSSSLCQATQSRLSGGRTAGSSACLLTAKPGMTRNICMSISRSEP